MARPARQIARKHHYVPEMYLSGFGNSAGQCFVVDATTRKTFHSPPSGISAKRDYNLIEIPGVPADALEKELGNFEGVIAPGIKRVRTTASFGENGEDREDVINLITLLAVRNPRTRKDMERLYGDVFQAMISLPFQNQARWEAVVGGLKAGGRWPKDKPADYEGHKKFVEDNKDKLKPHQNFTLEMELSALEQVYPYFDALKWRILKARDDSGVFVTTDHPVCIHRPENTINYGQQLAPGFGKADQDIIFPISSQVALIGRLEGDEDVIEVHRHCVASINATVIGFAMSQIYAANDRFSYTRPVGDSLGKGSNLCCDPNLQVHEGNE